MNHSHLWKVISDLVSISEKEFLDLLKFSKFEKIKKKSILLKKGEISKELIFIEKGICRSYYKKEKKEITSYIYSEGNFLGLMKSLLTKEKSELTYQAISDIEIFKLDYESLEKIYLLEPKYERLGRKVLEKLLIDSENRLYSFLTKNPSDRYLDFMKQNKNMDFKIPDSYIASMLGITAVSLSRIKSRIFKKK